MEQYGFQQHVKGPTTNYGSLLEHVYVNKAAVPVVDIVDTNYSDHDSVHVSIKL